MGPPGCDASPAVDAGDASVDAADIELGPPPSMGPAEDNTITTAEIQHSGYRIRASLSANDSSAVLRIEDVTGEQPVLLFDTAGTPLIQLGDSAWQGRVHLYNAALSGEDGGDAIVVRFTLDNGSGEPKLLPVLAFVTNPSASEAWTDVVALSTQTTVAFVDEVSTHSTFWAARNYPANTKNAPVVGWKGKVEGRAYFIAATLLENATKTRQSYRIAQVAPGPHPNDQITSDRGFSFLPMFPQDEATGCDAKNIVPAGSYCNDEQDEQLTDASSRRTFDVAIQIVHPDDWVRAFSAYRDRYRAWHLDSTGLVSYARDGRPVVWSTSLASCVPEGTLPCDDFVRYNPWRWEQGMVNWVYKSCSSPTCLGANGDGWVRSARYLDDGQVMGYRRYMVRYHSGAGYANSPHDVWEMWTNLPCAMRYGAGCPDPALATSHAELMAAGDPATLYRPLQQFRDLATDRSYDDLVYNMDQASSGNRPAVAGDPTSGTLWPEYQGDQWYDIWSSASQYWTFMDAELLPFIQHGGLTTLLSSSHPSLGGTTADDIHSWEYYDWLAELRTRYPQIKHVFTESAPADYNVARTAAYRHAETTRGDPAEGKCVPLPNSWYNYIAHGSHDYVELLLDGHHHPGCWPEAPWRNEGGFANQVVVDFMKAGYVPLVHALAVWHFDRPYADPAVPAPMPQYQNVAATVATINGPNSCAAGMSRELEVTIANRGDLPSGPLSCQLHVNGSAVGPVRPLPSLPVAPTATCNVDVDCSHLVDQSWNNIELRVTTADADPLDNVAIAYLYRTDP